MIRARLARDPEGRIVRLLVRGHAGYAERGRDIVCAAVSAITQTALLGLEEHLGLRPEARIAPGDFAVDLSRLPEADVERAQDILSTAWLGLEATAREAAGFLRLEEGSEATEEGPRRG